MRIEFFNSVTYRRALVVQQRRDLWNAKCNSTAKAFPSPAFWGIPDDYKDRIFEKFVQVDATDQRTKGGTGLGLSIARQIVIQLGGEIGFEPAPEGGTIFKVEFRAFGHDPSNASSPNGLHRVLR